MDEKLTSTRKFLMKTPQLPPTIVPAEPGWENLGWFDGRLFSSRIIAWRIEMKQCEEHGIEEHVVGISADGFNSNSDAWSPTAILPGEFSSNPIASSKTRLN
jgi:hypothetical protein